MCSKAAWDLCMDTEASRHDGDRAVAFAKRAVELRPEVRNNWSNLGVAQYRAKNFRDAVATLEKAARLRGGDDPLHRFFLAMAYWQVGKRQEAAAAYGCAVVWMEAERRRMQNEEQLGFRAEAEALMGKPPVWTAPAIRAIGHAKAKLWGEAIADYAKAIAQAPEVWGLWQGRARAYRASGGLHEALADFSKAIELNGRHAGLRRERGALHARRGNWAEAARDLATAVEMEPAHSHPWMLLGAFLCETGDRVAHHEICEKALQRFADTQKPHTAEQIAKMCLLMPGAVDNAEAAAGLADRAVAIGAKQGHGRWFQWAQWAKGLAEYRRGRFASAIDWVRKCRETARYTYLIVYCDLVLAMAHHKLGQTQEARQRMGQACLEVATRFPKLEDGPLPDGGRQPASQAGDWVMCHILLREAELTLGQEAAPPAGQEGDQEKPGKQE
jgi:tetratricopeptide (TPR) repeat protein